MVFNAPISVQLTATQQHCERDLVFMYPNTPASIKNTESAGRN